MLWKAFHKLRLYRILRLRYLDEIAIVGDRLYTDIAVADQSDAMSILVLSGESTREDVKTSDVKPNVILEDLSEITKML